MFGWRKKPDGFEWHKYIRTTIKVRREARRQRVEDARRAAGQHMHVAGVAMAQGGRAAGIAMAQGGRAAGAAAFDGARAGAGALGLLLQAVGAFVLHVARTVGRPLADVLARPNVAGPLALAGAIALGAGIGRYRSAGLDREAATTLLIGMLLLAGTIPMITRMAAVRFPKLSELVTARRASFAVLAALALAAAWIATSAGSGSIGNLAGISTRLPLIGGTPPVQGRAHAIGGDTLRVGGAIVRLANIEAPERDQRCGKAGARQWRCGAAAESALARLIDGRTVQCSIGGKDAAGRWLGTCTRGGKDINAEMVKQGHVFALGSVLPTYGSEERAARAGKLGLWSGDAERPAAYRAKLWDEAKRRAPDGCPIKGQVLGRERVYVLPWSPDYERARVVKGRGERWFCSEEEAVAAGFRAADQRRG